MKFDNTFVRKKKEQNTVSNMCIRLPMASYKNKNKKQLTFITNFLKMSIKSISYFHLNDQ